MQTPGVFFAEDAHLFSTTVRDNLLVARRDAGDDELRDALRRSGLGRWLDGLPDGLSTILVGGAAAVSAGFVLWMVWGLGAKADLWGLALMALGLPVFWWVRRQRDMR